MRFNKIIAFGLIGLFLGIGFYYLEDSGFFQRWHKLSNPSDEIINMFSTNILPDIFDSSHPIQPCDYSFHEFSILWNPPKNIAECGQDIFRATDGYMRRSYIMDPNGDVWLWSKLWYAYTTFNNMIVFPIIGLVLGIIIGFIPTKRHIQKNS
jgi:hypothetical protein